MTNFAEITTFKVKAFNYELLIPSHRKVVVTSSGIVRLRRGNIPDITLRTKKGAQQMTNAKNTKPNTFVAFCSFLT